MTGPLPSQRVRVGPFEVHQLAAADSGGSPVVLLHGFGGWAEAMWPSTIGALRPSYSVYAPDMLGFGRSSKPEPRWFDVPDPVVPLTKSVAAWLDAVGIERATFVGLSLGGAIAMRLALDEPRRVDRLVLVASSGLGRSIHYAYKAIATPGLGPALVRPNKDRIRRMWRMLVHDPATIRDALVDQNYEILSEPGASEILLASRRGVNLVGQRSRFTAALPALRVPTLVVWGRNDRIFPIRHAERAARLLPNAELAILERCGHLPPYEQPEAFNRVLLDWLRRTDVPVTSASAAAARAETDRTAGA